VTVLDGRELKTVRLQASATPTTDTFVLTLGSESTAALDFDATAADVADALNALDALQHAQVEVQRVDLVETESAAYGWEWFISFPSELGNVAALQVGSVSVNNLVGSITPATLHNGYAAAAPSCWAPARPPRPYVPC
jgi:hypothetical protein